MTRLGIYCTSQMCQKIFSHFPQFCSHMTCRIWACQEETGKCNQPELGRMIRTGCSPSRKEESQILCLGEPPHCKGQLLLACFAGAQFHVAEKEEKGVKQLGHFPLTILLSRLSSRRGMTRENRCIVVPA